MSRPRVQVEGLSVRLRREYRPIRSLREMFVGLAKRRPRSWAWLEALQGVRFEVGEGELLAVVGANGAGKTTLLRVLAGIIPPSAGSVKVRGRIAPLIDLGAGFDPELTGDENISLYGSILGLTRAEIGKRRDEIFDFAGLRDVRDVPVKSYSAGMVARLGFAIATSAQPQVLLIDEVLAVGDEDFRSRCFGRIEMLRAQGTGIVLVSHDLELVGRWASRALFLEAGLQRSFGSVENVTAAYRAGIAA